MVIYSKDFEVLGTSYPFSFEGESIEFCTGLAIHEENMIFSYGIWDRHAVLIKLRIADCIKTLGLDQLK